MEISRLIVKYKKHKDLHKFETEGNYFSLHEEEIVLSRMADNDYKITPLYSKKYAINKYLERNGISLDKTNEIGNEFYSDHFYDNFDVYEKEKSKVFTVEAKNKRALDDLYFFLNKSKLIEYVEYDTLFVYPEINNNDTKENENNPLHKINAQGCWEIATGEGVCIAVLDSGININNEDIQYHLWKDKYGNFGKHFFENGKESFDVTDSLGHGTKIAEIIGATINNNIGTDGLASGSKIMTIKLSHNNFSSSFFKSDLCRAIDYAVQQSANIISISWTDESPMESNLSVVERINNAISKGIIVVCCTNNTRESRVENYFPANLPQVITVGVIKQNNRIWGSIGEGIDIFAVANGWSSLEINTNSALALSPATSWGSPQVCALIAMILQLEPNLTTNEILQLIQENAQIIDVERDGELHTLKLIDVLNTLESIEMNKDLKIMGNPQLNSKNNLFKNEYNEATGELPNEIILKLSRDKKLSGTLCALVDNNSFKTTDIIKISVRDEQNNLKYALVHVFSNPDKALVRNLEFELIVDLNIDVSDWDVGGEAQLFNCNDDKSDMTSVLIRLTEILKKSPGYQSYPYKQLEYLLQMDEALFNHYDFSLLQQGQGDDPFEDPKQHGGVILRIETEIT